MSNRIPEYSRYVSSITITNGGSGYATVPTITITGGGGTGATATATVFNGIIQTVNITNIGSGYTTSPTVTVTGGGGSSAVLVAVLSFAALPTTEYQEISSLGIKYTIPEFIREDYPDFVTFLEKYYEFMDQTNSPGNLLLNKRYYDIDDLNDAELNKKALEFAKDFPQVLAIEKKKLYKNIKSLYESKGSERSIKAFFRLVYGEEIEVSYPTQFILRASDGIWQQDNSVKVLLGYEDHKPTDLYGKAIDIVYYETTGYSGSIPNRRADTVAKRISTGVVRANKIAYTTPSKYELFLELPRSVSSIPGPGSGAAATLTIVSGVITAVTLTSGGSGYLAAPDVIITSTGSGINADIVAIVEDGSVTEFIINNGGSSYVSGTTTIAFNAHSINSTVATSGTAGQFTCGKSAIAVGDLLTITGTLGGTGTITGYTTGSVYKISAITGTLPAVTGFTLTTVAGTAIVTTAGTLTGLTYTVKTNNYYETVILLKDAPNIESNIKGYITRCLTSVTSGGYANYSVPSVTVTAGGSGYTSDPTVAFSGGGGSGAAATSVRGKVTGITVTAAGSGYTSDPTVTIGSVATATATRTGNTVTSITVTAAGSGYTSDPTVTITGGVGSGATATANRTGNTVTSITVTNVGSGYTSDPTVTITGGVDTRARATAVRGTVTSIDVTAVGSGYTSDPTVTFTGGGGTGAAATVTRTGNTVTSITVTNGGSGYTSNPTVIISGGSGTGARATAVRGTVTSINVKDEGSGYTSNPTVTISGGAGSGATATSVRGTVTSIIVSNEGSGYSSAPTVTFTGGAGSGATATAVLESDAGFKVGDVFSFVQTENDRSYITVEELDSNNVPTSWTILAPGSGYTSASTTDTITSDTGETLQITLNSDYLFAYDGNYKNDRGKLSSLNILQDNFKFQNYSYIIKSSLPQYIWNDVFREHMHPAGKEVFGDLFLISDLDISIEFSTTGLKLNEFITEDLTDAIDALIVSFSTSQSDSTTNSEIFSISLGSFFADSSTAAEIDIQDYGPEDYFPLAYTGIVGIAKTVGKSLSDSSVASDVASINMSWNTTFTDPFGFGTNPSANDTVVLETTWTRSFADSATASDAGIITLLNYIDPTYFSEDYVGEITNIT